MPLWSQLGKSKAQMAGCQEGQTGALQQGLALLSTGAIFSLSGKLHLCSEGLSTD